MTQERSEDKWLNVAVRERPLQMALVALAQARGVETRKPPRTRSVIALRCDEGTCKELVAVTQRVALCLEHRQLESLDALLGACGAAIPPTVVARLAGFEVRMAVEKELGELYWTAFPSDAIVLDGVANDGPAAGFASGVRPSVASDADCDRGSEGGSHGAGQTTSTSPSLKSGFVSHNCRSGLAPPTACCSHREPPASTKTKSCTRSTSFPPTAARESREQRPK